MLRNSHESLRNACLSNPLSIYLSGFADGFKNMKHLFRMDVKKLLQLYSSFEQLALTFHQFVTDVKVENNMVCLKKDCACSD